MFGFPRVCVVDHAQVHYLGVGIAGFKGCIQSLSKYATCLLSQTLPKEVNVLANSVLCRW